MLREFDVVLTMVLSALLQIVRRHMNATYWIYLLLPKQLTFAVSMVVEFLVLMNNLQQIVAVTQEEIVIILRSGQVVMKLQ